MTVIEDGVINCSIKIVWFGRCIEVIDLLYFCHVFPGDDQVERYAGLEDNQGLAISSISEYLALLSRGT